ncbi:MAG: DNA replication and repair protein RecF [Ignavibacteria bacterium]|nr:MAG: DNA replication and repair protein RecF [Ignavibacteria bacterium]
MILKNLTLKNFRLHKNSSLNFSNSLNYIVGGNGQGKTTILEAIYYLSTTKSLIAKSDSEALNFDALDFELFGEFEDKVNDRIRIYYSRELGKKSIFLNDKQIYRTSSIIGKFPVVTLSQSDHYITFGSPSERRKFVDSVISQSSSTYLNILLDYNKTLRQRSSLLNRIRETGSNQYNDHLDAWTENLVKLGTELVKRRLDFIEEFNSFISNSYKRIMEEIEIPLIKYSFLAEDQKDNIESKFKQALSERRNDEIRRASNLVGPHRDDFIFEINGNELRKFGSQGQHKTFQIALRFGEFFYLKNKLDKSPVFLMDDIFGELDKNRSSKISEYLKDVGQAFITMTDLTDRENLALGDNDSVIHVNNGECSYA